MPISQVQPLLILLASLFFLPALCAIKFEYCNNNIGYDFGNITRVTIDYKEDDTTIYVLVNPKRSLKEGSVSVRIGEIEPITGNAYDLNEVADPLPIKPGSSFFLILTQVPLHSNNLRSKVTVTLFDDDEEYTKSGVSIDVLCITFYPHNSTTSAALSE